MALVRALTPRRSGSDGREIAVARRRAALAAVLCCGVVLSATAGLAVAGGSAGLGDGNGRKGMARESVSGMQTGPSNGAGRQRTPRGSGATSRAPAGPHRARP